MARKPKEASSPVPESSAVTSLPAPTKPNKRVNLTELMSKLPSGANTAQRTQVVLHHLYGSEFCNPVLFDPNAPLQTAVSYIGMFEAWKHITGVEGVPTGVGTCLSGKPDSGKSTIGIEALVEAQRTGYACFLIDTEHKFNFQRFRHLGGDVTNLVHMPKHCLEDCFDAIKNTVKLIKELYSRGHIQELKLFFLFDSIGNTPTRRQFETGDYSNQYGEAARVVRGAARLIPQLIHGYDIGILFVNHTYSGNSTYGETRKNYGGDGLTYCSPLMISVNCIGKNMSTMQGEKYKKSIKAMLKVTKNHLSDKQDMSCVVNIGKDGITMAKTRKETLQELEDLDASGETGQAILEALDLDADMDGIQDDDIDSASL